MRNYAQSWDNVTCNGTEHTSRARTGEDTILSDSDAMNPTFWVLVLCVIATAQSALQLTMDEGDMKLIASSPAEDRAVDSAPQKMTLFTTSQVCKAIVLSSCPHALHRNVLYEIDYEGH
jgi:hypothetical protein